MVYFRAFVGRDRIGTDDPAAFGSAVQHGWVATIATVASHVFSSNIQETGAIIDFTNRPR